MVDVVNECEEEREMAKTANVYARVEPDIKDKAESILEQLGIPMSNAISIFLRQVVMHKGMPFDVTLPRKEVVDMSNISDEEFGNEIEKGMCDVRTGKILSAARVRDNMRQEYGI